MTDLGDIIEQLHQQHKALLEDLRKVQTVLDILDAPEPVRAKPSEAQHREKILATVGTDWMEKHQIAKATGIYNAVCTRILDRLTTDQMFERRDVNGATHYRRVPEEMRVHVGEGVVE